MRDANARRRCHAHPGADRPPATEAPDDTEEPAESEDDGDGSTGSLDDLIPDDLNGVAGTPIAGWTRSSPAALQGQGLDAGDAEFAFVNYGEGGRSRPPSGLPGSGRGPRRMEQLAQVMSGVGAGEVDVETLDIGGKTVLSFSSGAQDGVVYFYVADDVAFTIAGQNTGLVEQLLSELP